MAFHALPILRDFAPTDRTADLPGAPVELIAAFRAHYVGLCRLAFVMIGDPSAAEDIVQEAFLKTFAGWRRVREPARVQLYLRRAVINACRSRMRRRGNERRANELFHAASSDFHLDPDPEAAAAVVRAVEWLPPRQREVVILRYFVDMPEREIAEALGTHVGTVKSQLAKARRTLGQLLNEPSYE